MSRPAAAEPNEDLAARYRQVRGASTRLCAPLSPEDCTAQSMPDASPAKWHLAHTTWFFETFVLERAIQGYAPPHPLYRELFNSYYNTVGDQYHRPERGLVTRPGLAEIHDYRRQVDAGVGALLASGVAPELAAIVEIGLHHEQQHQELILTDLKHLLSKNPLHPIYRDTDPAPEASVPPIRWHLHPGGLAAVGHEGPGFAFDNEGPRHEVNLVPFALASRPVTVGEYLAFIEEDGYRRPDLWLADGWATVQQRDWQAPAYWHGDGDERHAFTLAGLRPLRTDEPVTHISYYEADAYARWSGHRLPSEAEWEALASEHPVKGNFQESEQLHPAPVRSGELSDGPAQLYGDVWEWTASSYGPYPGFRPPEGALGEYNGKFMANQMVLRGGSCATPNNHVRPTYRNFFYPDARWQFSGLRLARDA